MGAALARQLVRQGIRLVVVDKQAEALSVLAEALNAYPEADLEAQHCAKEACWEAELIILASPVAFQKEIADAIRTVATRKTVVHLANPEVRGAMSGAEALQALLPASFVVKAFNLLPVEIAKGAAVQTFIAGDSPEALEEVARLAERIGLRPVRAGGLLQSRTLEAMAALQQTIAASQPELASAFWQIQPVSPQA